jgi:amidohydrolase
MAVIDTIRSFQPELTAIRHDLHSNPELGLEEHRTANIVAEKLQSWGIEVHRRVGQTGVVGVLRRGSGGPAIGLRADMDCLPMEEQTNLTYRSQSPGRMHACGHDGHTTMLLGAAKYLAASGSFNGTVNFIFQPGEEGAGGALAMLADGLFKRFPCDAVFAMHNRPIRHRQGTFGGRWRVLRYHDHGPRRAWRSSRGEHRPGAGRRPHHIRPAIDRRTQRVAGGYGCAECDADRRR